MIPEFTDLGLLPPGIHYATFDEFEKRFEFSIRRKKLILGLKQAIEDLAQLGCTEIYVDGSFVTDKYTPGDYDAAWNTVGVDLNQVKQQHPVILDFENERKNQKAIYKGEFFPSNFIEGGTQEPFLTFFQKTKSTNLFKGIVGIKL